MNKNNPLLIIAFTVCATALIITASTIINQPNYLIEVDSGQGAFVLNNDTGEAWYVGRNEKRDSKKSSMLKVDLLNEGELAKLTGYGEVSKGYLSVKLYNGTELNLSAFVIQVTNDKSEFTYQYLLNANIKPLSFETYVTTIQENLKGPFEFSIVKAYKENGGLY